MKKTGLLLALLISCSLTVATEKTELAEKIRPEAQAWAQEVISLEPAEQELFKNLLELHLEVARQDQRFRKFMAGFLVMNQTIFEEGLQQKEASYTTKDVTKRSIALVKAGDLYRTSFAALKQSVEHVEAGSVSDVCMHLYESLGLNLQKAVCGFLADHIKVADLLLEQNRENLLRLPQAFDAVIKESFEYTDKTVQLIRENQKALFQINMLSLAADEVWKASFAGIQAALAANKPKEILQEVAQTLFQIYLDELTNLLEPVEKEKES